MLTDLRPVVERILRQLLVAGLPVLALGCVERGAVDDGGAGSGVAGTGGSAGAGFGGSGAAGGLGGQGSEGGGGQTAVACHPVSFRCGAVPSCEGPGGDGGAIFPLPTTTETIDFDPTDSRWADLYRACLTAAPTDTCGPDCRGLCRAVVLASGTRIITYEHFLACSLACTPSDGARLTAEYVNAVCGRRVIRRCAPTGAFGRSRQTPTVGEHLARAAALEAESIPAFGRLARALEAHGAPAALARAARVAMAEEARHWRRTRDLARRRGADPVRPRVPAAPFTSLETLAIDNIVEGCVRETFGAMVAAYQADAARDAGVRRLMTDIAVDERGHAALSWRIDAWAAERLGPAFREARAAATVSAFRELSADLVTAEAAARVADPRQAAARREVHEALGLPPLAEGQALLVAAWSRVWAPNLLSRPAG